MFRMQRGRSYRRIQVAEARRARNCELSGSWFPDTKTLTSESEYISGRPISGVALVDANQPVNTTGSDLVNQTGRG